MTWWIVKQPNGGYARFSEVIDVFDILSMSRDQAVIFCVAEMGFEAGRAKVQRADDNPQRWKEDLKLATDLALATYGDDSALRLARVAVATAIGNAPMGSPLALILNTVGYSQWRVVDDEWLQRR